LQAWYPGGGQVLFESVVRSYREVFPHAVVLPGAFGWGAHIIGSMDPLPERTTDELLARMPEKALADFAEWFPKREFTREMVQAMVARARPSESYLKPDGPPPLTDDRPLNEYFLWRPPDPTASASAQPAPGGDQMQLVHP
jgi:hypothetical protein